MTLPLIVICVLLVAAVVAAAGGMRGRGAAVRRPARAGRPAADPVVEEVVERRTVR